MPTGVLTPTSTATETSAGTPTPTAIPTPSATATVVPGTPQIANIPAIVRGGFDVQYRRDQLHQRLGGRLHCHVWWSRQCRSLDSDHDWSGLQLTVSVPATTTLGRGFVDVQVVNTDARCWVLGAGPAARLARGGNSDHRNHQQYSLGGDQQRSELCHQQRRDRRLARGRMCTWAAAVLTSPMA